MSKVAWEMDGWMNLDEWVMQYIIWMNMTYNNHGNVLA